MRLYAFFVVMFILFLLFAWANTGTLAPYANTLEKPLVDPDCGYLWNWDHGHARRALDFFLAPYLDTWKTSHVIKRLFYAGLVSLGAPAFSFELSGFLVNLLLHLFAMLLFWWCAVKTWGHRSGLIGVLLLVTYPGIYYWIGLPYAYNGLVPGSILCFLLLQRITARTSSWQVLLFSCLMGLSNLFYDLYIIFLPALFIQLLVQRRLLLLAPASLLYMLPMSMNLLYLKSQGMSFTDENNQIFSTIFQAYAQGDWKGKFIQYASSFPDIFLHVFFYSTHVFLPLLFLLLLALVCIKKIRLLSETEASVFLAFLILCLFLNLAPPYEDWQMRGTWLARIYQPVFVVFVFFITRWYGEYFPTCPPWLRLSSLMLLGFCIAFQSAVNIGPLFGYTTLSNFVHARFYGHGKPDSLSKNIQVFGSRPYGRCDVHWRDRKGALDRCYTQNGGCLEIETTLR